MNDLDKLLYDLLQRQGRDTANRVVDKRIDGDTFEITLNYDDKSIEDYVVLVQDTTILVRYEDENGDLGQDAIQTDKRLKPHTLHHTKDNDCLTISINHNGGNDGKQTHRR